MLSVNVCLSRPRPSLNSSTSSAVDSMMNARSAPEMSMAASSTRASTSCSTRPDPSARNPSSSAVIRRRSSRAAVVDRVDVFTAAAADEKDQIGASAPAKPDLVARPQRAFTDLARR